MTDAAKLKEAIAFIEYLANFAPTEEGIAKDQTEMGLSDDETKGILAGILVCSIRAKEVLEKLEVAE